MSDGDRERNDPHHRVHRRLRLLGAVLPLAALGFLLGGFWLASRADVPVHWSRVIDGSVGVAGGLVVVYLVITGIRSGERSRIRTLLSVVIGVAMLPVVVLVFVVDQVEIHGLFGENDPAPLASVLEKAAADGGFVAATFLKTGRTGVLARPSWISPDGTTVPLETAWSRNEQGILVTITPGGQVPTGQDGGAVSMQALPNGMIGVPLDFYDDEKRRAAAKFLGPLLQVPVISLAERLSLDATKPILAWSKAEGGTLPETEQGNRLLASLAGTKIPLRLAFTGASGVQGELTIREASYRIEKTPGIFSVDLDIATRESWSGDPGDGEEPMPGLKGLATLEKTLTITASDAGLLALPPANRNSISWYGGPVADILGWGLVDPMYASEVLPGGGGWLIQESDPTMPEAGADGAKARPSKP